MNVSPMRFDWVLEQEFLTSRAADHWALLRWAAAVAAPLYLVIGAWDEMIDPGSFGSTWPIRVGLSVSFVIFVVVIWRGRSARGAQVAWWVGYALSAIGFALILGEIEGGYAAGVGGFIVPIGLIALAITHLEATGGIAVLVGFPIIVYALRGASDVEIGNLSVWLLTGAAFAYVAFRVTDVTRRRAFLAERELEAERDKVDTLIRKMVPGPIAERLEAGEERISDRFDDVTVLFADIVGFTHYSEEHDAELVVDLLNSLFSRFDALVTEGGLVKIKTMGDGYMAAGGALPDEKGDHASAAAWVAIAMRSETILFCRENGVGWDIRIGINSGPLVAGVIGADRYAYDLWGDTVNIASRLESTGTSGEIHISAATAHRLGNEFELESLGPVSMKNREPVDAYRLIQPTEPPASVKASGPSQSDRPGGE